MTTMAPSRQSARVTFKVEGLDCAEEVAVLRREIGPLVGGEDKLAFDVLNGRMSVLESATLAAPGDICAAVACSAGRGLGLLVADKAAPTAHRTRKLATAMSPLWRRRLRIRASAPGMRPRSLGGNAAFIYR